MRRRNRRILIAAAALLALVSDRRIAAQSQAPMISRPYGRAVIEVALSHARPGGVFGVGVRNARWATANTLLDGRRGAMVRQGIRYPSGRHRHACKYDRRSQRIDHHRPGWRRKQGGMTSSRACLAHPLPQTARSRTA